MNNREILLVINSQKSYSFLIIIFLLSFIHASCSRESISKVPEIKKFSAQKGTYTHSTFQSKNRGGVDFNVYLPPNWDKKNPAKYPLIILLHGQGEDENSFPNAISSDSLNSWISHKILPSLVLIALRGGDNTEEMQWYSKANQKMITGTGDDELKSYCSSMFNTSMDGSKISVIGHSRGATGALYFALKFPNDFSSIISSAYVSDYILRKLIKTANANLDKIRASNIQIKMLIGTQDQYVLEMDRQGSYLLSKHFNKIGINHDLEVLHNKRHNLSEIWEPVNSMGYLKFCVRSWN